MHESVSPRCLLQRDTTPVANEDKSPMVSLTPVESLAYQKCKKNAPMEITHFRMKSMSKQ